MMTSQQPIEVTITRPTVISFIYIGTFIIYNLFIYNYISLLWPVKKSTVPKPKQINLEFNTIKPYRNHQSV